MTAPLRQIAVWDEAAARHLLSRTSFSHGKDDVTFALGRTLDDFVDNHILALQPSPAIPGDWVNAVPNPDDPLNNTRMNELAQWWLQLMVGQNRSLSERMTLFFHNLFTSEKTKVRLPQLMYIQNKLFRDNVFGNLKSLVKAVNTDPAMLIYLDGVKNTRTKPNENYSRELLELFTLGIGNYTENDIKEGSRALTGWRVNGAGSYFTASLFDSGSKTYLGQTGNWTHENIVDIIFSKHAAAEHFCRKLVAELVYYQPDSAVVTQLAALFRNGGYEIKPLLSALLKSTYFHSAEIRATKIKSPVELIAGCIRQFGITNADFVYLRQQADSLQQILLDPPDVAGWSGQRKWLSSTTYPLRNTLTDSIVNGKKLTGANLSFKVNAVAFARTFDSSENALQFVNDCVKHFFPYPLSDAKKTYLLETMLDGTTPQNWSTFDPQADSRLRKFYKALMRLPEFQLT